jgi:uroporphyrinogen-III synthase
MRILVTRPEPDGEKTAAKLRALGHEPVIASLLTVVFAGPPAGLAEPAALVLTSRNAVRALSRWPPAAGWRDRPVFVTGRGTGEAAERAGFANVMSADGDAADLAALVMAEIGPEVRPILWPAARDRSEGFLEGLRAKGYDIRVVEAYRAEIAASLDPAVCRELRSSRIDAVLLYSRRTAEAFHRAVEQAGLASAVAGTRILALSSRVAEPLGELGADIAVAPYPDEDSLLALLQAAPR